MIDPLEIAGIDQRQIPTRAGLPVRAGVALSLLRRHGPVRLLLLSRQLAQEHGAKGLARLVRARLSQGSAIRGLSLGPIAALAEIQRVPTRSTVLRGGRIVIVGTLDLLQCKKYRLLQKQEMLEEIGEIHAPVAEYRDVHRWLTYLQTADRVVVYRMPNGPEFRTLLAEVERLKIDLCYDIDDPVFDVETVRSNPNLPHLSPSIQRSLLKDAELLSQAMQQCPRITVSTEGLRDLVRLRFPKSTCHVIANGLDAETLHFGAVAEAEAERNAPSRAFTILLPSGSLAHAADTEVAVEGLAQFLERHPDSRVITIGHFDQRSRLAAFPQVKTLRYLAYSEYMRVLGAADVSLVPLVDCVFNASKSIVRLIDATAAGVPVIASPVGEYSSGELNEAFLAARSPAEWLAGLELLASSTERRHALVTSARRTLHDRRLLGNLYTDLDEQLKSFLVGEETERHARSVA